MALGGKQTKVLGGELPVQPSNSDSTATYHVANEFWLAWWFSRYHADEPGIYADTPLNQELAMQVWRGLEPERIADAMESIGEQIRRRNAD